MLKDIKLKDVVHDSILGRGVVEVIRYGYTTNFDVYFDDGQEVTYSIEGKRFFQKELGVVLSRKGRNE